MTRLLGGLALLLALACVGLCVLLVRQRADVQILERTLVLARHDLVHAKQAARVTAAAAPRPARAAPLGGVQVLNLGPYLSKDPDYAEYRRLSDERLVDTTYPDLDAFKLSPDQLVKLRELLIERFRSAQDARQTALAKGITDPRLLGMAVAEAQSDVDSDITGIVGADGAAQLEQMRTLSNTRLQIETAVGRDMELSGVGLNAAQFESLATSVSRALAAPLPPGATGGDYGNRFMQAIAAAAPGVVTPEQLAVLQKALTATSKQSAIFARARAAAIKDDPAAANSRVMVSGGD